MHQNLVLTEQAIGRHTKRLQKELLAINHELKLSEAQNMFSRILGMKDFHELKQVLKLEEKKEVRNFEPLNLLSRVNTLEHASKNMEMFFENGNINLINFYLNDGLPEIKDYIKNNSIALLKAALMKKQSFLVSYIFENIINLETIEDLETIDTLCFYLLKYDNKYFEQFFYTLKKPNILNKEQSSKLVSWMIGTKKLKNVKKLFNDSRISIPNPNYISPFNIDDMGPLNHACSIGCLDIVKFLIEEKGFSILNSSVRYACQSGNLVLVKYLIEEKNATLHYFDENLHGKCISEYSKQDFFAPLVATETSTLSESIKSNNLALIKYLIEDKKLKINEFDFLAIKTSILKASSHFLYLINFSQENKNYLEKNAQEFFDLLINQSFFERRQIQQQVFIAKYFLKNFKIKINQINYHSNNCELIKILKNNVK